MPYGALQARLSARAPKSLQLPGDGWREAAVLVPLFTRDGVPHVLFTQRPESLRQHAGQIAFPGGARDPEDLTPLHTALRETHEELGIPPEQVQVLGMLDEIATITHFRVAPFVGVIPPAFPYVPSPDEVASVLEVPLPSLLDPARRRTERRRIFDRDLDVYFYEHGPHTIWGATAHILRDLLAEIEAVDER